MTLIFSDRGSLIYLEDQEISQLYQAIVFKSVNNIYTK